MTGDRRPTCPGRRSALRRTVEAARRLRPSVAATVQSAATGDTRRQVGGAGAVAAPFGRLGDTALLESAGGC